MLGASCRKSKLDDTVERRRGDKIAARGVYRDPARSSRSHLVKGKCRRQNADTGE
jgi:hypothetical protein